MKNALIILFLVVFFIKCDNKKDYSVYYLSSDNILGIMDSSKLFFMENHKNFTSQYVGNKDLDKIILGDVVFDKKLIKNEDITYDSVFLANSWCELRSNSGIIYNAKIIQKKWNVDVFWPEKFSGNYLFELKEDKLFKTFLCRTLKLTDSIFPNQKTIDSCFTISGSRCYQFYVGIYNKNKIKEFYGIEDYPPYDMNILDQICSITVLKSIKKESKLSSSYKLKNVRDRFNNIKISTKYDGYLTDEFWNEEIKPPLPKFKK